MTRFEPEDGYEEPEFGEFNRRKFWLGAGAFALSFTDSWGAAAFDLGTAPYADEVDVGDVVSVHGVNVLPVAVEHEREYWDKYKDQLTDIVRSVDVIVPEIFRAETEQSYKLPIIGAGMRSDYEDYMAVYWETEKVAKSDPNGKKYWLADPAHGASWAAFRATASTPELLVDMVAFWRAMRGTHEYLSPAESKAQTTRRRFLSLIPTGFFLIPIAKSWGFQGRMWAETDIRHSFTAAHIEEVCRSGRIPKGKTVALIYPRRHLYEAEGVWGIVDNLQAPERTRKRIEDWTSLIKRSLDKVYDFSDEFSLVRGYDIKDGNIIRQEYFAYKDGALATTDRQTVALSSSRHEGRSGLGI